MGAERINTKNNISHHEKKRVKYVMVKQENKTLQVIVYKIFLTTTILAAASLTGYLFRCVRFPDTNAVVIYLLSVLIIAWLTRSFICGFLASVLATFLFNYFFAEPHYSFSVNDPNYMITFITMTVTALITSTLTSYAKKSALTAQNKETETKALYNLISQLTGAKDIYDIANIVVIVISNHFSCEAAYLCYDENGAPEHTFIQQISNEKQIKREISNIEEVRYQIEEIHKDFYIGAEFYDWPIYGSESILGIIRIPKEKAQAMNESQTNLLLSIIENAALAMDRFRAATQHLKIRDEIVGERYRANLLRLISHDLRTPLTGIIGTSEMLMDMTERDDPRYTLVDDIQKDADWLHSLVENVLNLTRLHDGKLALKKRLEAVEEVIGVAVNHVIKHSPGYDITVSAPHELLLVPMDARLIEQVIVNLLDNAIKHTKPGNEINITAELDQKVKIAKFIVKDSGTGITENDLPHVFQMFYTTDVKYSDVRYGIGLGLAICETIVKAHGGCIEAHNRTDGQGAEFSFTLPLEEGEVSD